MLLKTTFTGSFGILSFHENMTQLLHNIVLNYSIYLMSCCFKQSLSKDYKEDYILLNKNADSK